MQPSSAFCRAQQAHHHALACNATLDNVRRVANTAAAAWAKEGRAADLREVRKLRAKALEVQVELISDLSIDLSENPDRGLAGSAWRPAWRPGSTL